MSGILKGKVALVTGVSRSGQVGEAVAQAMAEQGAVLGIVARTQTNVETRAEELRRSGTHVMRVIRVIPLAADLTDETQVTQVVDRMMDEYGRIDTLVNLAGGLTRYKPAVEHALEDWQHEMGYLPPFCARARCFLVCGTVAVDPSSTSRGQAFLRPIWWPTTAPRQV